jgi:hypothetical protein
MAWLEHYNERRGASTIRSFVAYVEWDPESRLYVAIIPRIPGAIHKERRWMNCTIT